MYGKIETWDVCQVTEMTQLFFEANSFDQPIGGWNTASVTTMEEMLKGASSFNKPIGGWNTTAVASMRAMLYGASSFNQDIAGWDTSSVRSFYATFYQASSFQSDIGRWNTNALTDMYGTFALASAFNGRVELWDVSRVHSMDFLFFQAASFNRNISVWNTAGLPADMPETWSRNNMLAGASSFNYPSAVEVFGLDIRDYVETCFTADACGFCNSTRHVSAGEAAHQVECNGDLARRLGFDGHPCVACATNDPVCCGTGNPLAVCRTLNATCLDCTTSRLGEVCAKADVVTCTPGGLCRASNGDGQCYPSQPGPGAPIQNVCLGAFETSVEYTRCIQDPPNCTNLTHFEAENHLVGTIPASVAQLTQLTALEVHAPDLSSGSLPVFPDIVLSGTMPAEIGALGQLRSLILSSARLSGTIPLGIGSGRLENIRLDGNRLSGTVPMVAALLRSLTCDLGHQDPDVDPFMCWEYRGSAELRVKCSFTCEKHVCKGVRVRDRPSNASQYDGYRMGALAVFRNASDAVFRFLAEGATVDQLGQITCDVGYGSSQPDSWVVAAPGPSAKCSDDGAPFELAGCAECAAGKYSAGGASPCRDCQRGTYAADRRKDSCDACPAGTFQDQEGSTDCKPADPGHFVSVDGRDGQTACPPGTIQPNNYSVACRSCLPGHFQSHQAQTACKTARPGFYVPSLRAAAERSCPEGEFNTQGGQRTCDRCYDDLGYGPAYTTSGPGATRCDWCRPQHFMDPTGRVCLGCDPDKMNCTLAGLSARSLDILPGFFRMSAFVSDTALIRQCKYRAACVGGNKTGDESCDTGYQGPLCGVCRPNHFMNEQTFECVKCSHLRHPLIASAILLVMLLVCGWGVRAQHRNVERILDSLGQRMRTHLQFLVRASVMPKFKIVLPFLQTLGSMSWVYGVEKLFSIDEVEALFDTLEQFTLDLGGLVPIGCMTTRTAIRSLMINTLPLPCVTVLVLLYAYISNTMVIKLVWFLCEPVMTSADACCIRTCRSLSVCFDSFSATLKAYLQWPVSPTWLAKTDVSLSRSAALE